MALVLTANLDMDRYTWAASRAKILLPKAPDKSIADIGAGEGSMEPLIREFGGAWHGFDQSPKREGITAWDVNMPYADLTESFGIIICLEVLEHLDNPWLGMRHVAQLLRPGGYLLLTTPNPRWSRSRLCALYNGLPTCFTQSDLDLNHHVFTPWPHIVERMLFDIGMSVVEYATLDGKTSWWPGRPYNLRYPLRLSVAVANRVIEWMDPTACGMAYAMVARKDLGG